MAKTERGETVSVDDLLPPEIWRQILTKLPVKSILRCRSVCKNWYSLVSSPDFITYHAAQTLNHSTTDRVLVRHSSTDPVDIRMSTTNSYIRSGEISFYDESFVESHERDGVPEELRSSGSRIVGSCNGLVCMFIESFVESHEHCDELDPIRVHSFLIWNPSIRKFVKLPFSHLPPDDRAAIRYLLGFGFDSDSGDYKVLRVGFFARGPKYGVPVVSEIFDLRKGVWRGISPPMAPPRAACNTGFPESCVYLHGSLHWIGYDDRHNYVLVSFNLSSEVSQKMGMSDGIVLNHYSNYSVLVDNGLLSLAMLSAQQQGDYIQYYCTVWSMNEYGVTESWTKLFNIELPYALNHLELVRFWENGEVVIARRDGDNFLVVYNPQNRTSKALLSANPYVFDLCFYKESLVLL